MYVDVQLHLATQSQDNKGPSRPFSLQQSSSLWVRRSNEYAAVLLKRSCRSKSPYLSDRLSLCFSPKCCGQDKVKNGLEESCHPVKSPGHLFFFFFKVRLQALASLFAPTRLVLPCRERLPGGMTGSVLRLDRVKVSASTRTGRNKGRVYNRASQSRLTDSGGL